MLRYFGDRRPRRCADAENPAEYLLDAIGNTTTAKLDWPCLWDRSAGAKEVLTELERMTKSFSARSQGNGSDVVQARQHGAYSVSLLSQIPSVCGRVFQQYWRSPTYNASKFILGVAGSLLIGFSFFQPGHPSWASRTPSFLSLWFARCLAAWFNR